MNEHAGSGMSSFGRRILEKYGWKEGKGLGKNEDGMTSHVKVKQREDSAGLGIEEHDRKKVTENWWFNCFEQALSSVKTAVDDGSVKKKKKKKKDKKSKELVGAEEGVSQGPTYEELFKATGGRRLGMRARASQKAKWERTETGVVRWHKGSEDETTTEVCTSVHVEVDHVVEVNDEELSEEGDDKKVKKMRKKRKRVDIEESSPCVVEEEEGVVTAEVVGSGKKDTKKKKKDREGKREARKHKETEEEESKKDKKKKKKRKQQEEDC